MGEFGPVLGESGVSRFAFALNIEVSGGRFAAKTVYTYSADFELLPDMTDAASDLSTSGLVNPETDALGLSVFDVPGILERMAPLKDLMDSFVSALLKEG